MRAPLKAAIAAVIATGACALAAPAGASADCTGDLAGGSVNLVDSVPARWEVSPTGEIDDGALLNTGGGADRPDAFDSFPYLSIDDGTHGRETFANPAGACEYELDGRQMAFPAFTTAGGLELSRKTYIPASGPGFARFLNTVANPTGSAQSVTLYTSDGDVGGLGSDGGTTLTQTSSGSGAFVDDASGNYRLDSPVSWFTTESTESDPNLAHSLDAAAPVLVRDRNDAVLQEDQDKDSLSFAYRNVTVPAGGTVSYLSFESMRSDDAAAQQAARELDGQPDAAFAGLTATEMARLQNWTKDDDGDGVGNGSDNCTSVVNGDQSDLDRDAQGDACDGDIDGDGILNAVESAFGTNPGSADSDSDGVRDGGDDCPKSAGTGADGCPVAGTTTSPTTSTTRGASSTKVTVKRMTGGTLTLKSIGKVAGVTGSGARDCTHGLVAMQVELNHLTVSNRRVRLKADCTFTSKLTFRRPLARLRLSRLQVRAVFSGSDGLLASTSKRMKVK